MSWLRRHLWALLATCVALAGGLALGAGPLQGVKGDTAAVGGSGDDDLATTTPADDPFRESVTRAAGQLLVDARLQGAFITLVVLPDVDDDIVDGVTSVIEQADGVLAATVRVDAELTDPSSKTYVDSVAVSSSKGVQAVSGIPSDDTYALISGLLARAYVTDGDSSTPVLDEVAINLDSELQGAKLVTVDDDQPRSGSLVVVLTSGDHGKDDLSGAAHLIETKLITALVDAADAVLVATTPGASSPGGLLTELADAKLPDGNVSSLNVVNSAAGQVATVYALLATANGQAGDFGVVDGSVLLPPGLSVPRP